MANQAEEPDAGPLMKVREVAELFDVQPATIRQWLADGDIRGVKIGKGHYWRIPKSEVTRLATQRYGETL